MEHSPWPAGEDAMAAVEAWLQEAQGDDRIRYPHAFTLATVDQQGLPDARVVLAHRVNAAGLLFSTDSRSVKAKQLLDCPRAAAVFYWPALERQIRVRGSVEPAGTDESDFCFAERPRGSRVTAWISPQSDRLGSLEEMSSAWQSRAEELSGESKIARPEHWVAFHLRAEQVELWQAAAKRLHHRLAFGRRDQGWQRRLLWP